MDAEERRRAELEEKVRHITRGRLVTLPSGKKLLMRVHKAPKPNRLDLSSKTVEGRWKLEKLRMMAMKKRNKKVRFAFDACVSCVYVFTTCCILLRS